MNNNKRYGYYGAVTSFGRIIENDWYAETGAVSERRAKSNFKYRYKEEHGLLPTANIDLPGEVFLITKE